MTNMRFSGKGEGIRSPFTYLPSSAKNSTKTAPYTTSTLPKIHEIHHDRIKTLSLKLKNQSKELTNALYDSFQECVCWNWNGNARCQFPNICGIDYLICSLCKGFSLFRTMSLARSSLFSITTQVATISINTDARRVSEQQRLLHDPKQ